jgi:hypothetical protein
MLELTVLDQESFGQIGKLFETCFLTTCAVLEILSSVGILYSIE